jgi:hypothetical protein
MEDLHPATKIHHAEQMQQLHIHQGWSRRPHRSKPLPNLRENVMGPMRKSGYLKHMLNSAEAQMVRTRSISGSRSGNRKFDPGSIVTDVFSANESG